VCGTRPARRRTIAAPNGRIEQELAMMRLRIVVAAMLVLALPGPIPAQLQTPTGWKWRTDTPATLAPVGGEPADDRLFFVAMPPGWHVTTGPGTLLHHPDYQGRGSFVVEAEIFLFPGDSQEGYGVFVAGRSLDEAASTPAYLAFLARRDGRAGVFERSAAGLVPVADWMANDAVVPHAGGEGTAKNVLRVEVGPAEIAFSANGKPITVIPRGDRAPEGHIGFRIGPRVNLHASRLDVTYRLAPVPKK
jgi:hypothetical protein